MSLAPRLCFASVTHLKPQGCASAAFPPMIQTTSALPMSVQLLVIAPRPNVGPRLDTVGPCQILAWFSICSIPRPRATFQVTQPVSLVHELPERNPMVGHRLTVTPSA